MTKKLTLLLVVMMLAITSSAQIQRTILDCKLGVSTEAQVKKAMKAKGVTLFWADDLLIGENVIFAGVYFESIGFMFKKNKLCLISLVCNNTSKFREFTRALRQKYGSYESGDSQEDHLVFFDGKTYIDLDREAYEDSFGLTYSNNKLSQESEVNSSEL